MLRTAEPLSYARAVCTSDYVLDAYYDMLEVPLLIMALLENLYNSWTPKPRELSGLVTEGPRLQRPERSEGATKGLRVTKSLSFLGCGI